MLAVLWLPARLKVPAELPRYALRIRLFALGCFTNQRWSASLARSIADLIRTAPHDLHGMKLRGLLVARGQPRPLHAREQRYIGREALKRCMYVGELPGDHLVPRVGRAHWSV